MFLCTGTAHGRGPTQLRLPAGLLRGCKVDSEGTCQLSFLGLREAHPKVPSNSPLRYAPLAVEGAELEGSSRAHTGQSLLLLPKLFLGTQEAKALGSAVRCKAGCSESLFSLDAKEMEFA